MELIPHIPSGFKLNVVDGVGVDIESEELLMKQASMHQVVVEVKVGITDEEKFAILKTSRLLIFPSLFEGFGLPPGEALFYGTPVLAYELDVLKEIYSDSITYARYGDVDDLIAKFKTLLSTSGILLLARRAKRLADLDRFSEKLNNVVTTVADQKSLRKLAECSQPDVDIGCIVIDQLQEWNKKKLHW